MSIDAILIFLTVLFTVTYWVGWPHFKAWQNEAVSGLAYLSSFGFIGQQGHKWLLVLYAPVTEVEHGKPVLLCWAFMALGAITILSLVGRIVETYCAERKQVRNTETSSEGAL